MRALPALSYPLAAGCVWRHWRDAFDPNAACSAVCDLYCFLGIRGAEYGIALGFSIPRVLWPLVLLRGSYDATPACDEVAGVPLLARKPHTVHPKFGESLGDRFGMAFRCNTVSIQWPELALLLLVASAIIAQMQLAGPLIDVPA
jgi:hypothetical protein